jgi:nitric oxide reductase NorD protein
MTVIRDSDDLDRYRLVATALAGRPLKVEPTRDGEPGYTDGQTVYLPESSGETLSLLAVQCALLAAGSLTPELAKPMTGRPGLARRYLALEGWRALAVMADRFPPLPIVTRAVEIQHLTSSSEESLALAQSRRPIPDPPDVFGMIRPARLRALAAQEITGGAPTRSDLQGELPEDVLPEADEDEETIPMSSLSRLLQGPIQKIGRASCRERV